MNTIKLLKRDKRMRKGLLRFDLKKRMYSYLTTTCGKPTQNCIKKGVDPDDLSFFNMHSLVMLSFLKYGLFAKKIYSNRLYSNAYLCKGTGRPRGLISKLYLSRMLFKRLSNLGVIPGVKRASW